MGGTDILAIIFNRTWRTSVGLPMYLIDGAILLSQVFYRETGYHRLREDTLFCVISAREPNKVQSEIMPIDPEAFITISTVKGRSFF